MGYKQEELGEEDAKEVLMRTRLDIQVAGTLYHEVGFYSAHAKDHSILVLCMECKTTVWRLSGGSRDDRFSAALAMRRLLINKGSGE